MAYGYNSFHSFSGTDWDSFQSNIFLAIDKELNNCTDDYLLNVSEDEYTIYLFNKFKLEPIRIDKESEEVDTPIEFREDLSQYEYSYARYGRYRNGMSIKITYPYTGDASLFQVRPNPYTLSSYPIYVSEYANKVSFEIKIYAKDVEEFNREKSSAFNSAFCNVKNINNCVNAFNQSLMELVKRKFQKAKQERLEKTNFFAAINVKKTSQSPSTYGVSVIKKKESIKPTCPNRKAFTPEPSIDMETYENIIAEINQVGLSMERKPSLYLNKDEEGLRDVFITTLETRFDGVAATGETFNHSGKTDILLKNAIDGTNLFIAECKFWHGAKHFKEAISQLFDRYLTWRDSKTALMIFVNDTDFTTVLNSINTAVVSHPYYLRANGEHGLTSKSYIFHLPQDKQREVYLEIMAFNFDKNKQQIG